MVTIEELKIKINKNSRLIGLDLGSKRIGVSICDEKRLVATPFKTIDVEKLSNTISPVSYTHLTLPTIYSV